MLGEFGYDASNVLGAVVEPRPREHTEGDSDRCFGLSNEERDLIKYFHLAHNNVIVTSKADGASRCKLDMQSSLAQTVVGLLIIGSVLMSWLEIDFPEKEQYWSAIEIFLAVSFWIEAILRMAQLGVSAYFRDNACRFDFFLVICGSFSCFKAKSTDRSVATASLIVSSVLRMVRFLRIVRLFTIFRTLTVLVKGFRKAALAVGWVAVLMVVVVYSCSLVLTIVIGQRSDMWADETETVACWTGICPMDQSQEQIDAWFGSVPRSMMTLFMVTTLANWPLVVDVVQPKFPLMPFLLVGYIFLTTYAVLSLITAVLSENIINAVREDEYNKVMVHAEDRLGFLRASQDAFARLDTNREGKLSQEAFARAVLDPKSRLVELCIRLGVSMSEGYLISSEKELLRIFNQLHPPETFPDISVEDFVSCLSRTRGGAAAKHMLALEATVGDLHKTQETLFRDLAKISEVQGKIVARLEARPA
eukprot:TRINITY_DN5667_c0_g4_i1.p1 TRINITY_DN5667_c0_g4~~TRINITY_DN5667_c0_g4_i1.p1  ORF type:complete len:517 (+),score=69.00 TRINITY_DN5667_c0_g4_i1:126-1553(+)